MGEPIPMIDHRDAWDLAHYRQANSNLARCYIDLRKAVRDFLGGNMGSGALQRLTDIDATSADAVVRDNQ